jgi:hypothetical protein
MSDYEYFSSVVHDSVFDDIFDNVAENAFNAGNITSANSGQLNRSYNPSPSNTDEPIVIESDVYNNDITISSDADIIRVKLTARDLGPNVFKKIRDNKAHYPITVVKYVYTPENVIEVLSMASKKKDILIMANLCILELVPENFNSMIFQLLNDNKRLNPIVTAKYFYNAADFILAAITCDISPIRLSHEPRLHEDASNEFTIASNGVDMIPRDIVANYDSTSQISDTNGVQSNQSTHGDQSAARNIETLLSRVMSDTLSEILSSPIFARSDYSEVIPSSQGGIFSSPIRARTRTFSSPIRVRTRTFSSPIRALSRRDALSSEIYGSDLLSDATTVGE